MMRRRAAHPTRTFGSAPSTPNACSSQITTTMITTALRMLLMVGCIGM
jgi:hypothetical protein